MKKRLMRLVLCMAACLCLMLAVSGVQAARAEGLEVHFLDVGRNDGILIRCGGESAFIDSGSYHQGIISTAYMQSVGVSGLKYYIGSHAHADHIGGAPVIIDSIPTQTVIQPHDGVRYAIENNARTAPEKAAVAAVDYVDMTVGQQIHVGNATLTCLGPLSIIPCRASSTTENSNSLVLMLTYGEVEVLLSADATNKSLKSIHNANPGSLKADVYKNLHHNGETKDDVIEVIDPDYIVFSTSEENMPMRETLRKLSGRGTKILITTPNHSGNIVLRSDGQSYSFKTQYSPQSLTVKENAISIYEGKSASLTAELKPSGRFKALTFISDDPSVATVSGAGKITGVKAGTTTVRVVDGSGMEAACTVSVMPATLILKKTELSVRQHSKVTASWKIEPSGAKAKITWASMDESIAAVDEKGRITGVYPGETTITATMPGGQISTIHLTVSPINVSSVRISPSSVKMTIGDSRTLTAKISPANATWKDITWSSADEGIAVVSADGTLRAVGVGKTKITATASGGKTRSVTVTVNPVYVKKVVPEETKIELVKGLAGFEQMQLRYRVEPANATIQTMKWSSSNKRVAAVDANGVVTAVGAGSATITLQATDGSKKYARVKVTVEWATERIDLKAAAIELYEGKSRTIEASVYPRSKTKTLTYESLDPSVAVVDAKGKVTGVRAGQAVIRVCEQTGVFADCVVTVKPPEIVLKKQAMTIQQDRTESIGYSLAPSGFRATIVWASMDPSVATVNSKGRITGVYPGETIITASIPGGGTKQLAVTVTPIKATGVKINPSSVKMTIGESRTLTAKVSPANATWKDITWRSEDDSIALIDSNGLLRAVGVGETSISATTPEGKTRSAKVRVAPLYVRKITLSEPDIELIGGVQGRNQVKLEYAIAPADATIQAVKWTSADPRIAVVDENGVVTGLKAGRVYITCKATDGSGKYAKIRLTFKENKLERSVQAVPGELVVQPSRIRYINGGGALEIDMRFVNRTGSAQQIPSQGFLTMIAPDGEKIVLMQLTQSQSTVQNGDSRTLTYRVPVSVHPKLIGLDLTRCSALILNAQQAY